MLARTNVQCDQDKPELFATRGEREGKSLVAPRSLDVVDILYLEEGGREHGGGSATELPHGDVHTGTAHRHCTQALHTEDARSAAVR